MTISLINKGRLALKEQAAWGTAETSFASTDYLEAEGPITPPMTRETLGVETYRPGFTAPPRQAGSKAGTVFPFKMPLHGWSASTPSTDPSVFPDALLLKAILGGGGADGYTTAIAAGSSTSLVNVTNGSADAAWAGFAQLYTTASGYAAGWIKTVDTAASPDTLTPLVTTLAAAPTAGTAYGSYVAWLATAASMPLTVDWLGTASTAHVRYFDALPTEIVLTFKAKQQPTIEGSLYCINWTNVGSGGAPAEYAYGYPQMPACIGANGFSVKLSGGSELCPTQVVIRLTQTVEPSDCGSADQGVDSLVISNRQVVVEVTVNPSDLSTTPWTYTAGTQPNAFQLVANTIPGRGFSFCLPAPQVMDQPTPTGNGNLLGLTYRLEPLLYSGDTGSTAPADTAARAGFF